jgi:hypothetical protein
MMASTVLFIQGHIFDLALIRLEFRALLFHVGFVMDKAVLRLVSSYLTNIVVPAIGHDSEPGLSTSHLHNISH